MASDSQLRKKGIQIVRDGDVKRVFHNGQEIALAYVDDGLWTFDPVVMGLALKRFKRYKLLTNHLAQVPRLLR